MNFATLKGLTIPEGNVESIAIGGQTVWAKAPDDPWTAVFASIADGTYKEKYSIGDTVPLDLGSEGVVNMQIAGFDVDDLADGSGKAHISFISKELLKTERRMNPALVNNGDGTYQEGTGSIGGWEKCEMRTHLKETIKPMIREDVQENIVAVTKTQTAYNASGSSFTQTTEDDVWIPEYNECFGSSSMYNALFKDTNENRTKRRVGAFSNTMWYLRSAYNKTAFRGVTSYGSGYDYNASQTLGVPLGFCT